MTENRCRKSETGGGLATVISALKSRGKYVRTNFILPRFTAYQIAFSLQQAVFQISKVWPRDERFSLTDQVRRSARSIGVNLAESWAKRNYPAHFISKLTDADGELQETFHWLSTAAACEYSTVAEHAKLQFQLEDIGRKLGKMMSMPEKFSRDNRPFRHQTSGV